jgi:chromosomal replication initiation ATPase DnaA
MTMHANANTLPETHAPAAELPATENGHPNDMTIVEQLVMRAFEIQQPTLLSNRRGRAPVAFARQVAIYITHVHLGLSLTAAAHRFRRDRTTAAHACRRVEDRREDPDVDRRIEAVETALDHWVDLVCAGEAAR